MSELWVVILPPGDQKGLLFYMYEAPGQHPKGALSPLLPKARTCRLANRMSQANAAKLHALSAQHTWLLQDLSQITS